MSGVTGLVIVVLAGLVVLDVLVDAFASHEARERRRQRDRDRVEALKTIDRTGGRR